MQKKKSIWVAKSKRVFFFSYSNIESDTSSIVPNHSHVTLLVSDTAETIVKSRDVQKEAKLDV